MYINKANYNVIRFLCFVGINFFGAFAAFCITGLAMDAVQQESHGKTIVVFTLVLVIVWGIFLRLNWYSGKVKVYDSFFSNDPDGVMYTKVIAKSLGISEERVIKELDYLISRNYFKNCQLSNDGMNTIVTLSNEEAVKANNAGYKIVRCPNCGGENRIREGFVYACQYCSGKVE